MKTVTCGVKVYCSSFSTTKNRRRPESPAASLEKDNAMQIKWGRGGRRRSRLITADAVTETKLNASSLRATCVFISTRGTHTVPRL